MNEFKIDPDEERKQLAQDLEFLEEAPGMFGQMARYVYQRLPYTQPGMAFAAALSFMATLKSRRVRNEWDISPCLYTAVIAGTGTGKTQSQHVIADLCEAAGIHDMLMGKVMSDSGLEDALMVNPRQLLMWDEFGIALSAISKSTQGHQIRLTSTVMELYSCAGKVYRGRQYSDGSKRPRVDIKDPCLSIFAASPPGRFLEAVNQDFIFDGFIVRWLLFFGFSVATAKRAQRGLAPLDLTEKVRCLEAGIPRATGGDIEMAIVPQKILVEMDPRATKELLAYEESSKVHVLEEDPIRSAFNTRLFEQTVKLCMIMEEDGYLSYDSFLFALKFARHLVFRAGSRCVNVPSSNQERQTNSLRDRILGRILPGETVSASILSKRVYRDGKRPERLSLIEDIVDSGEWIRTQDIKDSQSHGPATTWYNRPSR